MADAFDGIPPEAMVAPVVSCEAITAGSNEFTSTRSIFIGTAGNFTVQFVGDSSAVTLTLAVGVYPFRINKCTAGTGLYALR